MPATDLPFQATLRDGHQVLLREIREADRPGVLEAFDHLSDESRYTRFMGSMKSLPEALLDDAVHPVAGRDFVIVAVAGDLLVGGARYTGIRGRDACEFAITLLDDWHRLGLAPLLMETLIAHARQAGVALMEGYVLASNRAMRRLARRLGFSDAPCPDDSTVRIVALAL
ncbi:GNAT family N-acetyltransferase [Cupriavidus agavae]|uniref:GNAT family N-acetyltransferase n=1 Tax=Cupriavidus agavae TaxID=1001822 RepID=UPI00102CC312|nr:GNAT family N-acetyltransferase [Cupriavidus agavae]